MFESTNLENISYFSRIAKELSNIKVFLKIKVTIKCLNTILTQHSPALCSGIKANYV